ncbi:MAG: metallo-beta-lactamase [Glaciihabitans sp.]|nr:metallo-beta-lactamase [Glaciihabitans sp.]
MSQLTTQFFGNTTILVTDGASSILIDGYFSRVPLVGLLGRVRPDEARIQRCLQRAGIGRLDLVAVSHSHIDHALDAPVVAERTGALLGGSASMRQIAIGYGTGETNFLEFHNGEAVVIGDFTLTPIETPHSTGDRNPGEITVPVTLPARVKDFRSGSCFSFHIAHPLGNVMMQTSANFLPGALLEYPSDLIYLAAGGAGHRDHRWRHHYWDETVVATGASTVIPVHWDRFWLSLDAPLVPLPRVLDRLDATLVDWQVRANASHLDLHTQDPWTVEQVYASH